MASRSVDCKRATTLATAMATARATTVGTAMATAAMATDSGGSDGDVESNDVGAYLVTCPTMVGTDLACLLVHYSLLG